MAKISINTALKAQIATSLQLSANPINLYASYSNNSFSLWGPSFPTDFSTLNSSYIAAQANWTYGSWASYADQQLSRKAWGDHLVSTYPTSIDSDSNLTVNLNGSLFGGYNNLTNLSALETTITSFTILFSRSYGSHTTYWGIAGSVGLPGSGADLIIPDIDYVNTKTYSAQNITVRLPTEFNL